MPSMVSSLSYVTKLRYDTIMNHHAEETIVIVPDVCGGRPVVRGTRITVQSVLEMLAAGDPIEEVLAAYPSLSRDDVLACLRFSSRLMSNHFVLEQVG